MAFDMGGLATTAFGWLRTSLFWGIGLFVLFTVVFGALIVRKRRKLQYPLLELTDLGAGKIGVRETKAGWFKTKKFFFGLYDYAGEEKLLTKDKREVQSASSEDFHDINGKRGLIVQRKPDDPMVLLPINKMKVENSQLMNIIAPADYRDASAKILKQAENETMSRLEKMMPYITFFSLGLVFFICIILIIQMVKHSQSEAKDLVLEAGRIVADVSRSTSAP